MMKKIVFNYLISLVFMGLLLPSFTVFAQTSSPVGFWRTIDDYTNRPRGIVQITEYTGVLNGIFDEVLP